MFDMDFEKYSSLNACVPLPEPLRFIIKAIFILSISLTISDKSFKGIFQI